jgi:sulfur relay (sulfurtransferase) complex TusBCD TusD component (DsrE family)
MKIGIILQSNKPEHIWNTFRFGITSLKASHEVTIFLMNEGAELDTISDTKDFDISKKVAEYKELKGVLYACGTCLELRGKKPARRSLGVGGEAGVCPVSTMTDLLKMVEESDKVLVFG